MSETIERLCAELSLTAVSHQYGNLADEAAKKKRSFVEYLEQVLRAEAALRAERSREVIIRLATFPSVKTLDQFDIRGRSALVTGAASGIGLAYAECMAEAGARVTLTDIDGEGAAREAQRLVDEGYEARWGVCDVASLDEVARVFDDHVAAYGGCDIAFANAGLDVGNGFWTPEGRRNPDGQIDVFDPERWYKSIGINLTDYALG